MEKGPMIRFHKKKDSISIFICPQTKKEQASNRSTQTDYRLSPSIFQQF
tara:strand:- start:295 stop:441 length:147 start_codon:yes stop_codon:yes gene_type:complete